MKMFKTTKALMLTAFAGLALASCSSDDATNEAGAPGNLTSYSFNLAQPAKLQCSSNDYVLGEGEKWYQKLMDFENVSEEQLLSQYPAYYKFKQYAPAKTDRGEAVSQAEYDFVMAYLKAHPNEGSTEFNHYNYYLQLVGKGNATYSTTDMNGASHTVMGSSHMDFFTIFDQNNHEEHCYDYNGGDGKRSLVLNHKITNATYHDSYGNNTYKYYKFYTIEYDGKTNMYLCFDYATHKDSGEEVQPDGVYDDWVIKVIPACDTQVTPDPDPDPTPGPTPDPTPVVKKGSVEVNLAAQDHKDDETSKLSVHVRDTVNFKVFIPVPATAYCAADDFYIVEKHYDKMSYNAMANTLEREINGQKVTIKLTYAAEGIYIESEGINAKVLEYCRNVYGDGITFEVWNAYNTKALSHLELIQYLNQSTIEFTDKQPGEYINTIIDTNVDAAGNKLDCTVTKK